VNFGSPEEEDKLRSAMVTEYCLMVARACEDDEETLLHAEIVIARGKRFEI
jgi:hypothetical protein